MAEPRIIKSNSPEGLLYSSNQTAQMKSRELALAAKKNGGKAPNPSDSDWAQWITATGGGLLGYSLASSFLDNKTDEDKRKESVWSKVLRELASIGAGAAGAYGGYMLGKQAATNDVNTVLGPVRGRNADPLWDTRTKNWVNREDATGPGPYFDLYGEKRDANSAWKWTWAPFVAGSAYGGGVSAVHGARRTGEWLRGGAPKQVLRKGGVVENIVIPENSPNIQEMKDKVKDIKKALNEDAKNINAHEEAIKKIKTDDAQRKVEYNANKKYLNDQFASDVDYYANNRYPKYQEDLRAWNNGTGKNKGPMPKAPEMPKKPILKNFVETTKPEAPTLSGYTTADLATAKSNLRKALGRRAAGGWLGAIASFLASGLMARQGWKNYKEESRVDGELRARGIDPSMVDLSN